MAREPLEQLEITMERKFQDLEEKLDRGYGGCDSYCEFTGNYDYDFNYIKDELDYFKKDVIIWFEEINEKLDKLLNPSDTVYAPEL